MWNTRSCIVCKSETLLSLNDTYLPSFDRCFEKTTLDARASSIPFAQDMSPLPHFKFRKRSNSGKTTNRISHISQWYTEEHRKVWSPRILPSSRGFPLFCYSLLRGSTVFLSFKRFFILYRDHSNNNNIWKNVKDYKDKRMLEVQVTQTLHWSVVSTLMTKAAFSYD